MWQYFRYHKFFLGYPEYFFGYLKKRINVNAACHTFQGYDNVQRQITQLIVSRV